MIEVEYAKIAKEAFSVRTHSDYSDFYVISKEEVVDQYDNVYYHGPFKNPDDFPAIYSKT